MPILKDNDTDRFAAIGANLSYKIGGSNYGFSAKRIEDLGSSEYTLVAIAVDVSGSVNGFRDAIEKCVKEVVRSCRNSPRADNLMIRLLTFDNRLDEKHGFRPLTECDETKYDGCIQIGGTTALYDAAHNVVESVARYGKDLASKDYDANGIVFVITDGADNASTMTPAEVKKAVDAAVQGEALESIRTVLVGVNAGGNLSTYLQDFKDKVGFDQYVDIGAADEKSLAKLAAFVSQSISSQSKALGTGGASKVLTF